MAWRGPNEPLRILVGEAQWTGEQFARAVNATAAEAGLATHYDRTAVSHWLAGRRPRPPVPALIAEVLTRRLGRTVTQAEAGFGTADHPSAPPEARRPESLSEALVTDLAHMTGPGQRRRDALASRTFNLAGLTVPAWTEAVRRPLCPVEGQRPLTDGEIGSAETMMRIFSSSDAMFGGGHVRAGLSSYLAHSVAPALNASYSPRRQRQVFGITTQLTYLCAFLFYDEELHGAAQRYYQFALDLAAHCPDKTGYAVTLRAMSVQAWTLRHYQRAIDLADAAVRLGQSFEPTRKAFLLGQLAVAHAAAGDRIHAIGALSEAERLLSKGTEPTGGSVGVYHPASLALQEAEVCAHLSDYPNAIGHLKRSLQGRPAAERRSRAITYARLAQLQLASGHLEEASATWHRFLDDYPQLSSGRATTAWRTMRSSLLPYGRQTAARTVLNRAALTGFTRGPTSLR